MFFKNAVVYYLSTMLKLTFAAVWFGAVFLIIGCDARAFSQKQAPTVAPLPESVWVTRTAGAQSCSPKSGKALEDGAADLKRAKVRVIESRKASDGKMHMQMCGVETGENNAYLIPRDDLQMAVAQGYVVQTK